MLIFIVKKQFFGYLYERNHAEKLGRNIQELICWSTNCLERSETLRRRDWSTNCLEQSERLRRRDWSTNCLKRSERLRRRDRSTNCLEQSERLRRRDRSTNCLGRSERLRRRDRSTNCLEQSERLNLRARSTNCLERSERPRRIQSSGSIGGRPIGGTLSFLEKIISGSIGGTLKMTDCQILFLL